MKWKTYVEQQNRKTYVLPPGWTARDKVAQELGCPPDKVDDNLRPGLRSGEIKKQQFRVWDSRLKRLIFVVAYARDQQEPPPGSASGLPGWSDASIRKALAMHKAGRTYAQIGAAMNRSPESVRQRLRRHRLAS